jgi:tetratricopeptide (TPR) repeat protein
MRNVRFLAALFLLLPATLLAQAQGRVKGTVTDTNKTPIPGAKIIITCPELSTFRKEVVTDKRGEFALLIVDATKKYLFHIEAAGYQPIEELHKPLIGAQTLEIDFVLKNLEQVRKQQEAAALEQPGYKELREGKELLDAGKKSEARAKFAAAAAAKPDLYMAWLQMAAIDLEAKKPADALAEAQKCLALSPNLSPCLAIAANAANETGDTAAYDRYMAAYKLANPTDPSVLFNEAAEYLNKQDDKSAKPLLEQVLQIDPNYPDALFQLGMIYVREGDSAKAKELLEKFIKVAPQHKDAESAKEMLKYL